MKKLGTSFIIAASLGVAFGVSNINNHAAAATWHKGTPTVLRGKYRTAFKSVKPYYFRSYLHITTYKLQFWQNEYSHSKKYVSSANIFGINGKAKYRKLKAGLYEIRGNAYVDQTQTWYVKRYSHNRVRLTYTKSFAGQYYYQKY
jgi:hypothetical protein